MNYFVLVAIRFDRTSYFEAGMCFADILFVVWCIHGLWFGWLLVVVGIVLSTETKLFQLDCFGRKIFNYFLCHTKHKMLKNRGIGGRVGFV